MFALAGQAGAVDYVVNTTTGVITADGTPVTSIGGTSFTVSFTGTKASFLFAGDLNIGASDTVTGVGSRAASFVAGNNANIDPGATFDFSATGSTAGAGGGGAGTGGGSGGRGSPGSGGTSGGAGNAGGALAGVGRASDGGTGGTGGNGTSGGSGGNGGTGGLGLAGVNSSSVAGGAGGAGNSGGARGTGGAGGIRADITNNCEINTPAGCISFSFTVNRNAGDGSPGNPGDDGNLGNAGNPGSGGVNSGAGLEISGGSGGGGGGKGGGGGGGWGSELRSGGDGGNGGNGGSGGAGGIGGVGGIGGAGGGAFEIIANGRANVGGALLAQGGDGTAGTGGTSGLGGSTGSGGSGGQGALGQPFPRGAGGDGGRGGTGGDGGAGGTGGAGGGGAGGTVKVVGSVTDAGGAGVDASGGTGGTAGGDGRFIIGSNTAGGAPAAVTGASTTTTTGSRAANPFIKGGLMTPQIPDLFGGAEAFGLFDGVSALASEFDAVRAGAPVDAVGALVRFDTVPFGFNDDFLGFDLVVLVNLTNAALSNPELGVDPAGTDTSFLVDLMIGGFANDPLFGGLGDVILAALDPLAVFGTLVSDTGTIFNARVGGAGVFGADLQNGGIAYLTALAPNAVPEPGTLVLFAIGLFGIAVLVRRRRPTKA